MFGVLASPDEKGELDMPVPHRLVGLLAAAALPVCAAGAGPADDDLDAALARETTVASSRARRVRETPGVITLFTRDELLASGARDLADVLTRVPGFQLGVDVAGGVGAGFRGIWGHEGKILYLVDGIEMNDLSYGTFLLPRHVSLDEVDRVEIIRGPGSAIYGGHAELAVVNVVTRAATVSGVNASMMAGGSTRAPEGSLSGSAGGSADDLHAGVAVSFGTGAAADRTYTDFAGNTVDLASASRIAPALVTARVNWRQLEVRALFDDYRIDSRDGYDAVAPRTVAMRFRTAALNARAPLGLGGGFTLTPEMSYRWEQPWQALVPDLPAYYYDVTDDRVAGRVSLGWDTLSGPSIVAGAEVSNERARVNDPSLGLLSYQGRNSVSYTSLAGFLEATVDTDVANFLAGARAEEHSAFGSAFVPRFAVTKVFQPFHAKLLASGAYRAPSIENVNYQATTIRPERTWVFEAEAGWQLSDLVYAAANAFDVTVLRPIVFSFDGTDVYTNGEKTGSRGVEAQVQLRSARASASLSYAFYTARGRNAVPAYAVASSRDLLVGFAGHQIVASAQLHPVARVVFSPAVTYLSHRAAYDGTELPGAPALGGVGPRVQLDLFAAVRDLGAKGVELGLGVRDFLDQGAVYVQPYPGGHAPLPAGGREVWLRLRYERG